MTPEQVLFIGFVASAITFGLKLLASRFDYRPNRGVLTVALYVISLGLAVAWNDFVVPLFPPFSDPVSFVVGVLQYVSALFALAAPVVGFATLIYNVLYEKVVKPLQARLFFS